MKNKIVLKSLMRSILFSVVILIFIQNAYGIGISPGRKSILVPEDLGGGWSDHESYLLFAPSSAQYSTFQISGSLETNYGIHAGIFPNNETQMLIDWINNPQDVLFVDFALDPGWEIPGGPGHELWIKNGIRHIETDPGGTGIGCTASVVSQLVFYQNYAPDLQVVLPGDIMVGEMFTMDVLLTDFHDSPQFNNWGPARRYSYEIDWDGDGQFDEGLSGLSYYNDSDEVVEYGNLSGWAHGEFLASNIFSTPGSHSIFLSVSDSYDITNFEIPINVISENVSQTPLPASIILLSTGVLVLFGFRKSFYRNQYLLRRF